MTTYFRQTLLVLMLCAAITAAMAIGSAQANPKLSELEQKIADLTLLHQQLQDRTEQAQAMQDALTEQRDQLAAEIQVHIKNLKITTFQQARQNPRTHYNIELLRTILTYMDELDAKIHAYESGRERLSYLRRLAEDDLRMIATLSDLKIDALTTQISLMINRYLPEAHVIQIDPQQVEIISAQRAWERTAQYK